jgi:perosamine synthetase
MLPFFKSNVTDDFQCIKQVLESNFLSEGKITEKFENELKKYLKVKYCATVNSGTSAIHLALIAAGVKADDEVILPPQTFIASALPILYLKAKPVFADINLDNGNICHLSIKKKITKKTKAIIVVHWGGYPCDLDEIKKVKKNKNRMHK